MNFKNKKIVILGTILVLGAAIIYAGEQSKNNTQIIAANNVSKISTATSITEKKAISTALAKSGGGTVIGYSIENNHNIVKHEVDIINGKYKYEIEINDTNGEIIKYEKKQINNNRDETYVKQLMSSSKMNLDDAKNLAIKTAGGGNIYSYEIDVEHGQLYYDIDVINGYTKYDLEISALTGEIVSSKERSVKY